LFDSVNLSTILAHFPVDVCRPFSRIDGATAVQIFDLRMMFNIKSHKVKKASPKVTTEVVSHSASASKN
jgi:hypothetical protein